MSCEIDSKEFVVKDGNLILNKLTAITNRKKVVCNIDAECLNKVLSKT